MQHAIASVAEEMRKLLEATIRDVVRSLLPEMVKINVQPLESVLKFNSERLQTMERGTSCALQALTEAVDALQDGCTSIPKPVNSTSFAANAEKEKRDDQLYSSVLRNRAVFLSDGIGVMRNRWQKY
uniref:Focal_AT domain-containing protein n=1 Tax=Ascaris lumbricoides TaxID=6252 RepID=A0A0M3IAA9_ASCLU